MDESNIAPRPAVDGTPTQIGAPKPAPVPSFVAPKPAMPPPTPTPAPKPQAPPPMAAQPALPPKPAVPPAKPAVKPALYDKTIKSLNAYAVASMTVLDLLATDGKHYFVKVSHGRVELGGDADWGTGTGIL
jgi:hypothetical protein